MQRDKLGHALLLFSLAALLLGGCSSQAAAPVYPDVQDRINEAQAVSLGLSGPAFGTQLGQASGSYYVVSGDATTIGRWYDRQVAESAVVYVDEIVAPQAVHRLYRLTQVSKWRFEYIEVAIQPIDNATSLLAIYRGMARQSIADTHGSWLRKAWGFVLGQTDQSPTDWLFGFLLKVIKPVRPLYEEVWLKPVLNSLLALRWLLRWNYGLLLIFFALCLGKVTDLVRDVINKPFQRYSWGLFAASIIMFIVAGVFLAAAIWETLNGFYDTSTSGQAWLQAHIYPFWSDNLRLLAAVPPGGTFLALRLDQPNLLLVPLLAAIAGILVVTLNLENIQELHEVLEQVNPREAERLEPFVVLADGLAQSDDAGCNVYSRPLRDAAMLAFLPLGVAIYFVAEKLTDLIEVFLTSIDVAAVRRAFEKRRAYRQPTRWLRFLLSFGLLTALAAWIVVVDQGALLETHPSSRIAGLFVHPVHAASAVSVAAVSPEYLAKPTAVATLPPTATPASELHPTPEPPTPLPLQEIKGRVTADVLNVRAGPGTGFTIIGKARQGQELLLLGRTPQSDWLFVSVGTQNGWVAARYVSTDHPLIELPVQQP